MGKILTYELREPGYFRYGSVATNQELIEKLGIIEHQSESLIGQICDHYCYKPAVAENEEELQPICERCPVTKFAELIGV